MPIWPVVILVCPKLEIHRHIMHEYYTDAGDRNSDDALVHVAHNAWKATQHPPPQRQHLWYLAVSSRSSQARTQRRASGRYLHRINSIKFTVSVYGRSKSCEYKSSCVQRLIKGLWLWQASLCAVRCPHTQGIYSHIEMEHDGAGASISILTKYTHTTLQWMQRYICTIYWDMRPMMIEQF